jgi:hypothetical protein
MTDRADRVDVVRGMALDEGAAISENEAARSEGKDGFDTERLKLRLFVDTRSTLVTVDNIDVDHVLGDAAVRQRVRDRIRIALSEVR